MYTNSGFVYVEYKDKLSQLFFEYQKVYLQKLNKNLKPLRPIQVDSNFSGLRKNNSTNERCLIQHAFVISWDLLKTQT